MEEGSGVGGGVTGVGKAIRWAGAQVPEGAARGGALGREDVRNWAADKELKELLPAHQSVPGISSTEKDVCAAGALSYPSAAKSLGDVGRDRFKAFGGGAAAKKGQGKEKATMFTEKKSQWKK